VTAKDLEVAIDPACLVLDLEASTFDECLNAFESVVGKHEAVSDPGTFLEQVRLRESALSTASGDGVAFPHARTNAVSRFFLAIGRSRKGIVFQADSPSVHLIFLIGTPPNAIAEYLGCVAWLARRIRDPETRRVLLAAETPEAFLRIITASAS
jgi:mannitol/fructose-specific phosphotransferase system IIA component (Ntr-type)